MIGQQYYGTAFVDAAANGMGSGQAVPLNGLGARLAAEVLVPGPTEQMVNGLSDQQRLGTCQWIRDSGFAGPNLTDHLCKAILNYAARGIDQIICDSAPCEIPGNPEGGVAKLDELVDGGYISERGWQFFFGYARQQAYALSGLGSGQAVPLNGTGEYFSTSGLGSGHAVPLNGLGAFFMQQAPAPGQAPMEGLGLLPLISPVGAALAQNDNDKDKMRDWAGGGAGYTALGLGLLAAVGFLSYQAGSAMAPAGKRPTWGWIAVPVGLLTGPIGLGVMGLISNQQRGG